MICLEDCDCCLILMASAPQIVADCELRKRHPAVDADGTGTKLRQTYYIRSRLTEHVMEVKGGSTSQTTPVVMYPQRPGLTPFQLWYLEPCEEDYFYIVSKHTKLVMDIKGATKSSKGSIIVFRRKNPEAGEDCSNQKWRLDELGLVDSHRYGFIESKLNRMVLDIKGAKRDRGTPVITYPKKREGNENQQWILECADD